MNASHQTRVERLEQAIGKVQDRHAVLFQREPDGTLTRMGHPLTHAQAIKLGLPVLIVEFVEADGMGGHAKPGNPAEGTD